MLPVIPFQVPPAERSTRATALTRWVLEFDCAFNSGRHGVLLCNEEVFG